jgi:UbiA prenyltransferase family
LANIPAYLRLLRPANIVTSVADVAAGTAIAGVYLLRPIPVGDVAALCISTACLYGGGIVFNDVFDADLDKIERPERPIPSGLISLVGATMLGLMLLTSGIVIAFVNSFESGAIAALIAGLAVLYNRVSKHQTVVGPFNMGLCRAFNLLLGISVVAGATATHWWLCVAPLLYIFAITLISQGEVHGGGKIKLYVAAFLYILVAAGILSFASINNMLLWCTPLIIFLLLMIFRPLFVAIREPVGKNIGKAVKAGVIALIVMDAAWAAAFGSPIVALTILLLLPISIWLAKRFAVT